MLVSEYGFSPAVPLRALLLSLGALVVPVVAAIALPEAIDEYAILLWMLALIPALLLAYYRGWRGVATALAGAMAVLSLSQAALHTLDASLANRPLLILVVLVFAAVAIAIGWVTELLHRERALAQQSAVDVNLLLTEEGTIRYASPSLHRVTGFASAQVVGSGLSRLVVAEDIERLNAVLESSEELAKAHVLRLRSADGRVRSFEAGFADHRSDPSLRGVVMSLRDVTERRELEARLAETQRMEAIGRLAGGLGHDYNNLLTAIRSRTRFLMTDLSADDAMREELEEIDRAATQIAVLTRQLLAFSRQQLLQPQVLDLNELVTEMGLVLRKVIGEGVDLKLQLGADLGAVRVDPGQIQQSIIDLAVHGGQAMADGGQLEIRTANVHLDEAFTRRFRYPVKSGDYVLLSISDTAPTWTSEARDRIFEPYFTTTLSAQSEGLGLATVYGVVKQSGGYIWAEDGPGGGNVYNIYLPRLSGAFELPRIRTRETDPSSATVLVVEDEDGVLSVVRRALLRAGYRVLDARHGEEALEIAAAHRGRVDLLLTDLMMPGLGGRDLAARLMPDHPGMAVLFMSGYTKDAALRNDLIDGEGEFLPKPFGPEELLAKVHEALTRGPREGALCPSAT
ncbi:MAG: response regulator [Longimicrobiales bacterium]